jgi:hypothetical protein
MVWRSTVAQPIEVEFEEQPFLTPRDRDEAEKYLRDRYVTREEYQHQTLQMIKDHGSGAIVLKAALQEYKDVPNFPRRWML